MNAFTEGLVTIVGMVIGLAAISTLVSKNATTAADIQAGFSGLGNVMGVAESPVTGATYAINLNYPNSGGSMFGSGPF